MAWRIINVPLDYDTISLALQNAKTDDYIIISDGVYHEKVHMFLQHQH
jgi:hypothetical protein